jgi:hypothetical protein
MSVLRENAVGEPPFAVTRSPKMPGWRINLIDCGSTTVHIRSSS